MMDSLPQQLVGELAIDLNRRGLAQATEEPIDADFSELFRAVVGPLDDVQLFCPDLPAHRYIVASTKRVIFGFAIGTNVIAFRLDARFRDRALATGAIACPECGEEWISFAPCRNFWPKIYFEFWALQAYIYAREIGG